MIGINIILRFSKHERLLHQQDRDTNHFPREGNSYFRIFIGI